MGYRHRISSAEVPWNPDVSGVEIRSQSPICRLERFCLGLQGGKKKHAGAVRCGGRAGWMGRNRCCVFC